MNDLELKEKQDLVKSEDDDEVPLEGDDTDKWIYVFVFNDILPPKDDKGNIRPAESKQMKNFVKKREARKEVFNRLRDPGGAGLIVSRRKIDTGGNAKMFLLINADQERLEAEAERIELQMKLKPEHGGGYTDFEISKKDLFELSDPERGELFRKLQKIQLIESIIEAPEEDQGAGLSLEGLARRGIINKYFPLHSPKEKKFLLKNWSNPKKLFSKQPIHEVRDYFGEEMAIYFAWLGFYTNWLWMATAVGFIAFVLWIVGRFVDFPWPNISVWAQVIYSIFLALWATFFLEYWKRYSHTLAHEWGMSNYEEQERPRAEYQGTKKPGLYFQGEWIEPPWGAPVAQNKTLIQNFGSKVGLGHEVNEFTSVFEGERKKEKYVEISDIPTPESEYYPTPYRHGKIVVALPIILSMLIVVVIATFSVLSFRLFVAKRNSGAGSFVGGIANAIIIMVMNGFWRKIAEILTRWENHRTMTSYMDQLILKIFLFQFVNSYTSLYYIAFFKQGNKIFSSDELRDLCKQPLGENKNFDDVTIGRGCNDELFVQVLTLLGTNIFVGQTREVLLPIVLSKLRFFLFQRKAKLDDSERKDIPRYQREAALANYAGTFDEYNEMIIQYGYVTLFAAAFPLAPALAVFNNVIEIRTDATKFLLGTNRPPYQGAQDIGTWYGILEAVGVIAVITNCALICFSYGEVFTLFDQDKFKTLGAVVILEHVLFLVKYTIAFLIPDRPGYIRKAVAKQEYIKEQRYRKLEAPVKKVWKTTEAPSDEKDEEEEV